MKTHNWRSRLSLVTGDAFSEAGGGDQLLRKDAPARAWQRQESKTLVKWWLCQWGAWPGTKWPWEEV